MVVVNGIDLGGIDLNKICEEAQRYAWEIIDRHQRTIARIAVYENLCMADALLHKTGRDEQALRTATNYLTAANDIARKYFGTDISDTRFVNECTAEAVKRDIPYDQLC